MSDLLAARTQMAVTLGFHIVLACLGVGMPVLLLVAEGLAIRRNDPAWRALARRWSKVFAVLFAVGAVSGTVLSFELGLLWPGFMGRYGSVIGLPFTLEGFAFFLEAIFVGIYLYGWDRLSPWAHWWSGVPIAVSGAASAWFVVTVNAWMNVPGGFREEGGRVVDVDPIGAMLGPATGVQTTHMILAAYVVTGFLVAAVYAAKLLRGRGGRYERRAMTLALVLGAAVVPFQAFSGDRAAMMVAATQPVKLAAMEGQFRTQTRAPLRIGGLPDEVSETTPWAIEIPGALSWLAYGDADARVAGLDSVPPELRPPVAITHVAFQLMLAAGSALLGLAAWAAVRLARRQPLADSRWFLRAAVAAGPASILALETGWIVTEVGRQPWIVQGVMLTRDAATTSPGVHWVLVATIGIYTLLGVATVSVLRHLARSPLPEEARGA
ncbi:MAG: cytochrome ubiquinol oxidase subunit I [Planctomycetes bacterium]|nr:cytochrome ubiquinol oxidase subunit I [Planctomycetota bacterium]